MNMNKPPVFDTNNLMDWEWAIYKNGQIVKTNDWCPDNELRNILEELALHICVSSDWPIVCADNFTKVIHTMPTGTKPKIDLKELRRLLYEEYTFVVKIDR